MKIRTFLMALALAASAAVAGYAVGESRKGAAVEHATVTAYNDGFTDALCKPAPWNPRRDGGGDIQDGAGNVCGEYEATD